MLSDHPWVATATTTNSQDITIITKIRVVAVTTSPHPVEDTTTIRTREVTTKIREDLTADAHQRITKEDTFLEVDTTPELVVVIITTTIKVVVVAVQWDTAVK